MKLPTFGLTQSDEARRQNLDHRARQAVYQFVLVTLLLLFALVCLTVPSKGTFCWTVPIVAAAFVSIGAVLGFLYSTFGDEEQRFSPVMAALTTALGGAGLADATNANGFLRRIYHELACAAGLDACADGLLLALAALFVPLGFFILYFYRRLALNSLQLQQAAEQARLKEGVRGSLAPAISLELDSTPSEAVFHTDPGARELAEAWLKREPAGEPGYDDLLADARAQIVLGRYDEAIASLLRCLALRPESTQATLLLGAAYVARKRHPEAVALLENLIRKTPARAPLNAWKLLGYARLFLDPEDAGHIPNLLRSISLTGKFLAIIPDDLGARLNRACAYGQLGPDDPRARGPLLEDLRVLFAAAPEARENVRALTAGDLDFSAWKDDPEFKALLAG
jgi:tetratricopeptide (TPR) repeat protein